MTERVIHRQEGLLFVVSAPSGTGKTSLCTKIISEIPNLTFSISHTTRTPRSGEIDGKNYRFVTHEEFMDYVSRNIMAEWTEIYGNCYGTAKETIQNGFDKGFDILFDIDETGARQLSESYPSYVVTILVLPPSLKDLEKRLVDRATDSFETVRRRLNKAKEEIEKMSWYRYVIVNDSFEDAASNLKSIISAERCRNNHRVIDSLLNV
jgi:guanylate kinase